MADNLCIQVQSILFHNEVPALMRSLESIERAVDLAIGDGPCTEVYVVYGDCSSKRILSEDDVADIKSRFAGIFNFNYHFFNQNLGSASGHNTLAKNANADYLLIQNPDVVVSPRIFHRLLEPFKSPQVAMVEAKQLPIEHPKDYDVVTGETGWATTACALIKTDAFRKVGGFDDQTFFLYCDDLDFSWMLREEGYRIIFQPSAVVFHDKRLSKDGGWMPSNSERYYSAEAACLLAYKWSRPDITEEILGYFEVHGDDYQKKAATVIRGRLSENRMPQVHDRDHKIAEFQGNYYTRHRFSL